ncbi:enoyl-CoA hydratase/isomerase family protein [Marinibacterium sp. SX1]|uniref:enoyl-CoA hydratase/isomerase family protein n=1 Tax=Marinibacterium sp. SX1 TaxID=3388424 RepID=UPI003D16775C
MAETDIRIIGRAGRITLTRPKALNALSYDMCLAIDAALIAWADDPAVDLVVLDAQGDKAFCAGGDIARLYDTGLAGDYAFGRRFWRDEYRMNARLADYPKPVISLMQGFTMGGGVGIGCHGGIRIVGDSSRMAMPECGIGLVPDVGGTHLLSRAPGRLGAYLGLTAARMSPGDAIHAGFADRYLPEADWPALIARLEATGDTACIPDHAPPPSPLAAEAARIDRLFAGSDVTDISQRIQEDDSDTSSAALKAIRRNSPLAMAATLGLLDRLDASTTIRDALTGEYRFTWRAMDQGDFLEGIRAQIIDKDRNPHWRDTLDTLDPARVAAMLAPLGADDITFQEETGP